MLRLNPAPILFHSSSFTVEMFQLLCFIFQVYDVPPPARNQGLYDVPQSQDAQGLYDVPPSQGVREHSSSMLLFRLFIARQP